MADQERAEVEAHEDRDVEAEGADSSVRSPAEDSPPASVAEPHVESEAPADPTESAGERVVREQADERHAQAVSFAEAVAQADREAAASVDAPPESEVAQEADEVASGDKPADDASALLKDLVAANEAPVVQDDVPEPPVVPPVHEEWERAWTLQDGAGADAPALVRVVPEGEQDAGQKPAPVDVREQQDRSDDLVAPDPNSVNPEVVVTPDEERTGRTRDPETGHFVKVAK